MKSYVWMAIIVAILIAIMFFGVKSSSVTSSFNPGMINQLDHVKGLPASASSSVVIVEYSDFECPACRSYYLVMKQLMVEFGSRVSFVYRHFPLSEIHANAELAARAAEAAGKQGKFWEMHDLLFEKQSEWSDADTAKIEKLFESYASLVGISTEQFKTDWMSKEIKNIVRAERESAIKLGLQGTPSFFINGVQIQNPTSVEDFEVLINAALKSK